MSYKKMIIWIMVGVLTNIMVAFIAARLLDSTYWDVSLFTGILLTAGVFFIHSSGGPTTNFMNFNTQSSTGMKMEKEEVQFHISPFFLGSLFYTIVILIILVIKTINQ